MLNFETIFPSVKQDRLNEIIDINIGLQTEDKFRLGSGLYRLHLIWIRTFQSNFTQESPIATIQTRGVATEFHRGRCAFATIQARGVTAYFI